MEEFTVLDANVLANVCGGENTTPPDVNTDRERTNTGFTFTRGRGRQEVQFGLQTETERRRTNYGICVDRFRQNPSPQGLRADCGLPSGQP